MQGFTCPALLGILLRFRGFRLPDCHRLWCAFPDASTTLIPSRTESRYPRQTFVCLVWAIPLSLAATKGVTVLFSFLPDTKMFQFSGLPRSTLWIQAGVIDLTRRGCPIRRPTDLSLQRLLVAFRCLLRPSSAASAQVSTMRSL